MIIQPGKVRIIPEENCTVIDACNYNEYSLDEQICAQHEDCNYFCDIGLIYYQDSDGDGLGNEDVFSEFCLDNLPEEGGYWVLKMVEMNSIKMKKSVLLVNPRIVSEFVEEVLKLMTVESVMVTMNILMTVEYVLAMMNHVLVALMN